MKMIPVPMRHEDQVGVERSARALETRSRRIGRERVLVAVETKQAVDDDFIDIGGRLDDSVFNLTRERPKKRSLGRSAVPWVYFQPCRAFRNLNDVETQSVNAQMRPQALHRTSHPGLQVFGMKTMQEQDRSHLLVLREPRQETAVCTRDNRHKPRQRDPVQVEDELHQFACRCPSGRIGELTESLDQFFQMA